MTDDKMIQYLIDNCNLNSFSSWKWYSLRNCYCSFRFKESIKSIEFVNGGYGFHDFMASYKNGKL